MEPTAIREIIDSSDSPIEIIEKISGIKDEDFEITVLGSCQYGTIYSTYMALSTVYNMLKQEKGFDSPTDVQKIELIKETLGKLGIVVKNFRVPLEVEPKYIQQLKEKIYNNYGLEDFETDYLSEPSEEDETDDYEWDNCVKAYKEITSVDTFFEVARDCAWDLWSAIPEASEVLLPGVVVEYPEKSGVSCYPLADMLQSNNYRLGIDMFIFLTMGIVKSIDCMCGFDT
jgi:hypothetical protein